MSAPTLVEIEPASDELPAITAICLPSAVEEWICPMTETTTCTSDENLQRKCTAY